MSDTEVKNDETRDAAPPLEQAVEALDRASGGRPETARRKEEPLPTTMPASDPELEDVDAADIDQAGEEQDDPFEKLAARASRMTPERIKPILEALLFVCDRPLPDEEIRRITGLEVAVIRKGMEKLQGRMREGISGIVLTEVAGGWQLRTDPESAEFVRRFLKVKPQRLTRAALETLAIIGYRQPVTRPEIEEVRAVDCGAVLKALLDRKLIKIIGKKEEAGRPLLYGTTREFLEFFNLKDLTSLPTLREFQELTEEHRDIVEKETPGDAPKVEGTVAALRDTEFEKRLQQSTAEGDAALEELESAMSTAETRTKETSETLNPKPDPALAPVGDGEAPAEAPKPTEEK